MKELDSYTTTGAKSPREIIVDVVKPLWGPNSLPISGAIYFLGLMMWSLTAWINGFGSVAPSPQQWIIAGIVPALILGFAYILLRLLIGLPRWTRTELSRRWPELQSIFVKVLNLVSVSSIIVIGLIAITSWITDALEFVLSVLVVTWVVSVCLSVFVRKSGLFADSIYYMYAVLGVLFIITLGILWYAEDVFPRLPQAFGGTRSECAVLDLDTTRVTPETLGYLAPAPEPDGDTPGVLSVKVNLLFRSSDELYVQASGTPDGPIIKLNGSVVSASIPCRDSV